MIFKITNSLFLFNSSIKIIENNNKITTEFNQDVVKKRR